MERYLEVRDGTEKQMPEKEGNKRKTSRVQ
jgi:hypothetical protein